MEGTHVRLFKRKRKSARHFVHLSSKMIMKDSFDNLLEIDVKDIQIKGILFLCHHLDLLDHKMKDEFFRRVYTYLKSRSETALTKKIMVLIEGSGLENKNIQ